MTIVIGVKCSDGIVIACDSRTTETNGHVHDDTQKLSVITFKDGHSAIIAQAGNGDLSSRAVEIIARMAEGRAMDDYRSLPDCARDAIVELKDLLRVQYRGSAEELQKHFENRAFELMMAHYFNREQYIFTVDFVLGEPVKRDRLYCSIGCGQVLADFLISRLEISKFTCAQGIWTAFYAIEEIKTFDARCGGATRAGIVKPAEAFLCIEPGMIEAANEAIAFSKESKANWINTTMARIDAVIKQKGKT